MNYFSSPKGFILVQALIGIFVIAALASIAALSLSSFRQDQGLANGVDDVVALINEARSRTLSGDGGLQYGVHFTSSSATLFEGAVYASGAAGNKIVGIDPSAIISSISLAGGGAAVVFDPLTGDTDQYGTLVLRKTSSTSGQKTITITGTGLVSSN